MKTPFTRYYPPMTTAGELRALRANQRTENRTAILDAAERVVGREGIVGASIHSIAHEAGVSVGTLYNYFGDRERLLGALVLRHREELSTAIELAREASRRERARAQTVRFIEETIALFDRRRTFVRAALETELWRSYAEVASADEPGQPRVRQQLETRCTELIEKGVREGTLSPVCPRRMAAQLCGALQGVLLFRAREAPDESPNAEAEILAALFWLPATGAVASEEQAVATAADSPGKKA